MTLPDRSGASGEARSWRSVETILEDGMSELVWLALHVREVQDLAGQLAERLDGRPGVPADLVKHLHAVSVCEVRL